MTSFLQWRRRRFKFCKYVCFLILNCISKSSTLLTQSSHVTKTTYDIILVKYAHKNVQILESDFGKSQNWKSCHYHSNFKFSIDEIWLKVKLIFNKNLFVEKIYHEKSERGAKIPRGKISLTEDNNILFAHPYFKKREKQFCFSRINARYLLLARPTLASHVSLFLLGHFPTNECKISDFCL